MNISSDKLEKNLYMNNAVITGLVYSKDYSVEDYYITDKSCKYGDSSFDVLKKMESGFYKVVKHRNTVSGYRNFDIIVGGKLKRSLLLHRARWASFKEIPCYDEVVRHLNGDKRCNDLSNLMIGKHHDNARDVSVSGAMSGSNNPSALIDDGLAMAIYVISNLGLMSNDIVKMLPIEAGSVYNIKNKSKWRGIHSNYSELIDLIIKRCVENMDVKCENKCELLARDLRRKLEKKHEGRISKIKKNLHSQIDSVFSV